MTGRRIVRADGILETTLGIVLVAGAAAGWLDAGDFPGPVGRPLILAVGIALVLIGPVLWRAAVTPRLLRILATANATTAAATLVWWLAAPGFSTAGSAIVLGTSFVLALLAGLQLRAASAPSARKPSSPGPRQVDDERRSGSGHGADDEPAAHPLDELA